MNSHAFRPVNINASLGPTDCCACHPILATTLEHDKMYAVVRLCEVAGMGCVSGTHSSLLGSREAMCRNTPCILLCFCCCFKDCLCLRSDTGNELQHVLWHAKQLLPAADPCSSTQLPLMQSCSHVRTRWQPSLLVRLACLNLKSLCMARSQI